MTELSFYHLNNMPIEKALTKLLEKIIISDQKVLLLLKDQEEVKKYDDLLWSNNRSFIAHGSEEDEYSDIQPIYLTYQSKNVNNASILIILNTLGHNFNLPDFKKIINIFNGSDELELQKANTYWQSQDSNIKLIYWWQDKNGWSQQQPQF